MATTKWEYKTVLLNADFKFGGEVDEAGKVKEWKDLDLLGEEGWELVAVPFTRQDAGLAVGVLKKQVKK